MTTQLRSPSASMEPYAEWTTFSDTLKTTHTHNAKRGDWRESSRVLNNERNSMRADFERFLGSAKAAQMDAKALEDALVARYNEKLEEREERGRETVRTLHKDRYNPQSNRAWVRRRYRLVLQVAEKRGCLDPSVGLQQRSDGNQRMRSEGEDEDDDEVMVGMPQIKVENEFEQEEDEDSQRCNVPCKREADVRVSGQDDPHAYRLDKKQRVGTAKSGAKIYVREEVELVNGKACSRSLALLHGGTAVEQDLSKGEAANEVLQGVAVLRSAAWPKLKTERS
jgi:hypothetical protein